MFLLNANVHLCLLSLYILMRDRQIRSLFVSYGSDIFSATNSFQNLLWLNFAPKPITWLEFIVYCPFWYHSRLSLFSISSRHPSKPWISSICDLNAVCCVFWTHSFWWCWCLRSADVDYFHLIAFLTFLLIPVIVTVFTVFDFASVK